VKRLLQVFHDTKIITPNGSADRECVRLSVSGAVFGVGKRIAAIISKREVENSCEGIFGQVFVNAPTDDILGNEVFEFPADLIQIMKIPECFPDDKGIKLAFFISCFFSRR